MPKRCSYYVPTYRIDMRDANVVKVWRRNRLDNAMDKFREGVNEHYDEVTLYQFNGPGDAEIVARYCFYKIKKGKANA